MDVHREYFLLCGGVEWWGHGGHLVDFFDSYRPGFSSEPLLYFNRVLCDKYTLGDCKGNLLNILDFESIVRVRSVSDYVDVKGLFY